MPTYYSYDRAELAFREVGAGLPLLVVPGGPARDASYLGDLTALARRTDRKLIVPDLRGTGSSVPESGPESHRASRLAADVATLVDHLRMAPVDVLAHSAGASVTLLLAEGRPDLVSRLVLVTPGTSAVGIEAAEADWEAALALRADEPWHDEVRAALEAEDPTPEQELAGQALFYGRWDNAARAHAASDGPQRNAAATEWFHDGAFDPGRTRDSLVHLNVPVRIIVGELDVWPNARAAGELAALFPDATVLELPGAGHFPWVDDETAYADAVARALRD